MNKQKYQKGSIHLFIIIVLIVALLGTLGFVYYQNFVAKKDVQTTKTDNNPSPSKNVDNKSSTENKTEQKNKAQKTEQELITQAMGERGIQKADGSKVVPTDVIVVEIIGNNARGEGNSGGEYGGFEFIANKSDAIWSIIYVGQQMPGKNIGVKYGLPDGWYDSNYDTIGA